MREYDVIIRRAFSFTTKVEARSALEASRLAEDSWSVPDASGENMREELQTMRRAIKLSEITPLCIVTTSVDII